MAARSIVGALPALVYNYGELQAYALSRGIAFQIADYGGLRTRGDTALILKYRDDDWRVWANANPVKAAQTTKEAWRPISPWGKSMHNYGAAFDIEIVSAPAGMSKLAALNVVLDKGEDLGMASGRDFNNPDPPHLELRFDGTSPGATALAAAKAEWQRTNGTDFFRR
jgi:hypothetical protein